MTSSKIENNDSFLEEIKRIVDNGKIHHGYILEGPSIAGKEALALHFAKSILCNEYNRNGFCNCSICRKVDGGNHVDLTLIRATRREGSKVDSIKDQDVELLQERLKTKPLEGDRNLAIIADVDTMTKSAFNRLLKTLEEPPVGTVIMLLSENVFTLPQTVRSRCIHLRVNPWETLETEAVERIAKELVSLLLSGAPYYQLKKAMDPLFKKEKKEIFQVLDAMEEIYREKLPEITGTAVREKVYNGVHRIEEAREEIKSNINNAYAMKKMALAIGGQ